MGLSRSAWAVLLACASVLGAGAPAALAANPPPPDPLSGQSLKDGCQRDPAALIAAQTPEWAYVYNTPAGQPPPPQQWVSGIASSYNPAFQAVHTSGADLAFGHDAMDFNLNILPDPQYSFLLGGSPTAKTGNYAGDGEETDRLHTEWEDLTIAKFVWPEPGDRVTERGAWVWDCGHWGTPTNVFSPDYDLPHEGQPCPLVGGTPISDPSQCAITGERTEFHPYSAIWVQRAQSPLSPYGESQGDLFVSTQKTKAGKEIDCAHKFPPPPSLLLPNPAFYGADFRNCVDNSEPNWQDVSGDYSFFLAAPPRPAPGATLTYRAVDRGSVGAPAPRITPVAGGVRVSFHLHSVPDQPLVMAYTVFTGWSAPPAQGLPTHLRVTLDKLEIHRAMDPGCSRSAPLPGCQLESTRVNQVSTAPGDWNIFWDVNGIWGQWAPGNGEFLPNDGDVLTGHHTIDLYVPAGKGWRLYVHGRECDINDVDPLRPLEDCPTNRELADDNDVPGAIVVQYPSAAASLGTHRANAATAQTDPTSTCPYKVSGQAVNPDGCYSLVYTVSAVQDLGARAASAPGGIRLAVAPRRVTTGRRTRFRFVAEQTPGHRRLRGVTIRFAGHVARTDRHGRATIIAVLRRPGIATARATRAHLRSGRVSVKARRPHRRSRAGR